MAISIDMKENLGRLTDDYDGDCILEAHIEGEQRQISLAFVNSQVSYEFGHLVSGDIARSQVIALSMAYLPALKERSLYRRVHTWLGNFYGDETEPLGFYRELFPEGSFERKGHHEDGKPNGIAISMRKNYARTHIVTDGLEAIKQLQGHPLAFMSPIGYIGKSRAAANARKIYAVTYDLDGIQTVDNVWALMNLVNNGTTPQPTWIVHSGHGLHLYYQFREPLDAYPNIQEALREVKYRLYDLVWNRLTSADPHVQRQGVAQGFRIVGSASKLGAEYPVTAWRTGPKAPPDYLMSFIPEKSPSKKPPRTYYQNLFDPPEKTSLPIDQARELYPDWCERRVDGTAQRQTWAVNRALYDWWLDKVQTDDDVVVGHRYFCLMMLAVYARKCSMYDEKKNPNPVTEEELVRDAMALVPYLDGKKKRDEDAFTEDDAIAAINAFADSYTTFPRRDVERLSGLAVPANPHRKGQKQADHLEEARAIRDIKQRRKGSVWNAGAGRPKGSRNKKQPKKEAIAAYFQLHPDASNSQASRDLKISRPTIVKYRKEL